MCSSRWHMYCLWYQLRTLWIMSIIVSGMGGPHWLILWTFLWWPTLLLSYNPPTYKFYFYGMDQPGWCTLNKTCCIIMTNTMLHPPLITPYLWYEEGVTCVSIFLLLPICLGVQASFLPSKELFPFFICQPVTSCFILWQFYFINLSDDFSWMPMGITTKVLGIQWTLSLWSPR